MKKALAALAAVLAAVVVLGPRPRVDTTRRPPPLPADLDAYLAASESRFDDLREGTEKTIVWADSAKAQTEVAVVYLHGFSATREEVRPLADTVAARLGANLFYTRLAGHGRPGAALGAVEAGDWIEDAYEAIEVGRRLGRKVVLIGTSTGATLATWLAAQPDVRDDLGALVLISPNFHPRDGNTRMLLWPWGTQLAHAVVGREHAWEPANDAQAHYWTTRYPTDALVTMMSLVALVEDTDLGTVETPTLVIYSPEDDVVDPTLIEQRFPAFGAATKRLVAVEPGPSNHVLAGDILAAERTLPLADTIRAFLAEVKP